MWAPRRPWPRGPRRPEQGRTRPSSSCSWRTTASSSWPARERGPRWAWSPVPARRPAPRRRARGARPQVPRHWVGSPLGEWQPGQAPRPWSAGTPGRWPWWGVQARGP
uniref:Uncharacterized protein n=1 Tax=Arundo donax TaxID=35708 RepID=A0A0A9DJH1_ARUDO